MGCSPWNSLGQNTGVGSLSLLQGIFPTQVSNPCLLNYRRVLYQLSHKGTAIGTNKKFLKMKLWNQNRYDFDYFRIALAVWWGSGTPLQYSCLENPMKGGAWWAAVHGVTQSRTRLKRRSSSSLVNAKYICIVADKNQLFYCYIPCPRPVGLAVSSYLARSFLVKNRQMLWEYSQIFFPLCDGGSLFCTLKIIIMILL